MCRLHELFRCDILVALKEQSLVLFESSGIHHFKKSCLFDTVASLRRSGWTECFFCTFWFIITKVNIYYLDKICDSLLWIPFKGFCRLRFMMTLTKIENSFILVVSLNHPCSFIQTHWNHSNSWYEVVFDWTKIVHKCVVCLYIDNKKCLNSVIKLNRKAHRHLITGEGKYVPC